MLNQRPTKEDIQGFTELLGKSAISIHTEKYVFDYIRRLKTSVYEDLRVFDRSKSYINIFFWHIIKKKKKISLLI